MDKLESAIRIIVGNIDKEKYPAGMSTEEIIEELRRRGQEFGMRPEFIVYPDVCNALRAIYGLRA